VGYAAFTPAEIKERRYVALKKLTPELSSAQLQNHFDVDVDVSTD